MLIDSEFLIWCDRLQLHTSSIGLIQLIRFQNPSHIKKFGEATSCFLSLKMERNIQFKSQFQAEIEGYEKDNDVLEFYANSTTIYLDYLTEAYRRVYHPYIPDFFVIRKNYAGWEDWKSEDELLKLSKHSPNRWQRTENSWQHVPGKDYARNFNFSYTLQLLKRELI